MHLTLQLGRPEHSENRLEKELRTYDLLDQLQISYERVDHHPAETIDDCVEIDRILKPATICKNLLLCNTQKTNFYLLMLPGEKKFVTKELSKQLGTARLSFAPSSYMEEYLDITPGSVSVLGLMNDHQNMVQLLVDEELLQSSYVGCHPCINTSSLRLKTRDVFETFLTAVHHNYIVVKLGLETNYL